MGSAMGREAEKIREISCSYMDYRPKEALTPEMVPETFARLNAVIKKYDIHIFDMYNVDEIGFRIGCIASSTVITHKNVKEVSQVISRHNSPS